MTEGTWVRLDGEAMDVAALAELFESEVSIRKDTGGTHYIKIDDPSEDPHEALVRAEQLLEGLNGIARVQYASHRPVKAGAVCQVNAAGTATNQVIFGRASIVSRSRVSASGTVISADGKEAVPPQNVETSF